jgi:hypothetical protein
VGRGHGRGLHRRQPPLLHRHRPARRRHAHGEEPPWPPSTYPRSPTLADVDRHGETAVPVALRERFAERYAKYPQYAGWEGDAVLAKIAQRVGGGNTFVRAAPATSGSSSRPGSTRCSSATPAGCHASAGTAGSLRGAACGRRCWFQLDRPGRAGGAGQRRRVRRVHGHQRGGSR